MVPNWGCYKRPLGGVAEKVPSPSSSSPRHRSLHRRRLIHRRLLHRHQPRRRLRLQSPRRRFLRRSRKIPLWILAPRQIPRSPHPRQSWGSLSLAGLNPDRLGPEVSPAHKSESASCRHRRQDLFLLLIFAQGLKSSGQLILHSRGEDSPHGGSKMGILRVDSFFCCTHRCKSNIDLGRLYVHWKC